MAQIVELCHQPHHQHHHLHDHREVAVISNKIKKDEEEGGVAGEWKYAAMVMDRSDISYMTMVLHFQQQQNDNGGFRVLGLEHFFTMMGKFLRAGEAGGL